MTYLSKAWAWLKGLVSRITGRFPFLKRKLVYIPLGLVLLVVIGYAAFAKPAEPAFETAVVARQDIVKLVSETGTITPAEEVDLSFTGTGRISRVYVTEGQEIRAGQLIATLESTRQYADLLSARARLKQAEATAGSGTRTRAQTEAQQDQLVENAERELRSGDLAAYLIEGGAEGTSSDFSAPIVSGTYRCSREGTYRIELYPSKARSGGSFRLSGLETTGPQTVSTVGPVPLGTCGLYVQFPTDFAKSRSVVWEIPVPNVRSGTYQSRKNAYDAAVENRRLALEETERSPLLNAQVEEARAAVLSAESAFADTRLVAPFTGTITKVDAVRGDIASIGTPAASLISAEAFEIKLSVLEDDIGDVNVGDMTDVTFDAYDGAHMEARVSFIPPSATNESGAASFEVTLQFTAPDERIRAGLSVDADIRAAEATGVIAIPTRSVIEENGVRYVRVMISETAYRKVPVATGLSGSGMIEVREGLAEGDRIITFANEEALAGLTEEE
ncbi:MAG: HlyD family secretion protein [Candidatus Parcubacteria bacterium]|jgi:RND family efflux transporter MFP subunit|nr:HlyD family secretion protein [Candidatus Parcubacteria bacterium]